MKNLLLSVLFLFFIIISNVHPQVWENCNTGIICNWISCIKTYGNNIYVGTDTGLFKSTNNGNSWKKIKIDTINLQVMSFNSKDKYLFAGTYNNGIYRSSDDGIHWNQVNQGINDLKCVYTIEKDSINIFVGSVVCLFSSSNYGNTWKRINLPQGSDFRAVIINNSNINVGGYYCYCYSLDYGKSWKLAETEDKDGNINQGFSDDVQSMFIINNTILEGGNQHGGFHISYNYGKNWQNWGFYQSPVGFVCSIKYTDNIIYNCGIGGGSGFAFSVYSSKDNKWGEWYTLKNGLGVNPNLTTIAFNSDYFFCGTEWGGTIFRLPRKYFNNPNASITGKNQVCTGDTSFYNTKYEDYVTTTWQVTGGDSIACNDSTIKIYWNQSGKGSITLIKQNNTTQVIDSSTFDVIVFDIPDKPKIIIKGDTLLSSSQGGNQWFKDGKAITGAEGQTYFHIDSGFYSVQVTKNGCVSDMSDSIYLEATGINDLGSPISLQIYPQPVTDILYIYGFINLRVYPGDESTRHINIYSVLGILVMSTTVSDVFVTNDSKSSPLFPLQRGTIDVSWLPAGVYIINMGDKVEKFVKL